MRIVLALLVLVLVLVGGAIAWVAAGRWLTLALDRIYTLPMTALPTEPLVYVPSRLARSGIGRLDVSIEHALAVGALPAHHDDPFDRLLVAQAEFEGMTLVSVDERILCYPIKTLRA